MLASCILLILPLFFQPGSARASRGCLGAGGGLSLTAYTFSYASLCLSLSFCPLCPPLSVSACLSSCGCRLGNLTTLLQASLPAVMWQEMQKINDSLVATILELGEVCDFNGATRCVLWHNQCCSCPQQYLPHAIFDLCASLPILLQLKFICKF